MLRGCVCVTVGRLSSMCARCTCLVRRCVETRDSTFFVLLQRLRWCFLLCTWCARCGRLVYAQAIDEFEAGGTSVRALVCRGARHHVMAVGGSGRVRASSRPKHQPSCQPSHLLSFVALRTLSRIPYYIYTPPHTKHTAPPCSLASLSATAAAAPPPPSAVP
jgi:hypothetical protein